MTAGGENRRGSGLGALRRLDLRQRLMWLAMLPVLVFAVVWGSYVIRQRSADLRARQHDRAQLLARQLAVAADYAIFSSNQAVLDGLVQGVARESSVLAASIIAPGGQPLATHRLAQQSTETDAQLQSLIRNAMQHGQALSASAPGWVAYLQPVYSPSLSVDDLPQQAILPEPPASVRAPHAQGYAVVEISTRSADAQMWGFGLRVMALLAGVLLSGWLMARRFSRRIDQRIQAVVQAAQRIGAGEESIRLPPSRIPSFDRLSQNLNSMAIQLEQSRRRLEQRVRDATRALRQQRDAAQQANRDKTSFLAAASHDLRQPMQALALLVEALKQESDPAQRARLVERIEITSHAMNSLLDALLDISRLDAGGVRCRLETFDLRPLLARLRETWQGQAQSRRITLVIHDVHVQLHSDPLLLERILGNFLSNALRYTAPGGCILLAVRRRANACLIQVRDNGPGIAQAEQRTIFREFVQLHNPQRDRSQGLGLGLAIVQRLSQLLNHPVGLRSCPGRGSTFDVRVPLGRASLAGEGVRPASVPAHPALALQDRRVLLVEDDALVRESYANVLHLWGCDARLHASADEALAALAPARAGGWYPQLVITDHRLGGTLNGRALVDALRARARSPLPAIVLTGDTEEHSLHGAADLCVLYKPVKPMQLQQAMLQLLGAAGQMPQRN